MHCEKIETLTIISRSNTIMPGLHAKSMGKPICLKLMKRITQQGFYHPRHTFYAITFKKIQSQFYHFCGKMVVK